MEWFCRWNDLDFIDQAFEWGHKHWQWTVVVFAFLFEQVVDVTGMYPSAAQWWIAHIVNATNAGSATHQTGSTASISGEDTDFIASLSQTLWEMNRWIIFAKSPSSQYHLQTSHFAADILFGAMRTLGCIPHFCHRSTVDIDVCRPAIEKWRWKCFLLFE